MGGSEDSRRGEEDEEEDREETERGEIEGVEEILVDCREESEMAMATIVIVACLLD